ncbi:hypothetical protein N332_10534, partial [Mesitornis unicolor]
SSSRSSLSSSTSDPELAMAGDTVDTPADSPAQQHAGSEEGTAMPEAFGDTVLEMDWLLQGLGADGEDVTCSACPKPVFSVDFDAKYKKEHLLEASCLEKFDGAGKRRGA